MCGDIRLAIVGCGEITRIGHLPAAATHPGIGTLWLIDADVSRARRLAEQFHLDCQIAPDYKPVLPQVDALINALPNSLHAPVNLEAIHAGVHVLCEKPLATTAADARACCERAEEKRVLLAVGMNRRFVASHTLLPIVLQEGYLGEVLDYDWPYGGIFDWTSASGFYFSRTLAGGGALIDFGVHLLDSLFEWFGPAVQVDYQDDDWGSGIEANAILELQHSGPSGAVKGQVRVSRTYHLRNRLEIRGTKAHAQIPADDPDTVVLHRQVGQSELSDTFRLPNFPATTTFYKQMDNFIESIRGNQKLESNGWQALRVIKLIEQCYANRRRIPEPWSEVALPSEGAAR
jgi:predicted dehydrogenase